MIKCELQRYLEEAKLSISSFCKEMNITRTTYYNWIKGEKFPTIEKCFQAATILSCELKRTITILDIWKRDYSMYL